MDISIKVYGNTGCGTCFQQYRVVKERLFEYKHEKINCSDLSDAELKELKIRQIPTTIIYDGDTIIKRYTGFTTPETILSFIYEYKKTKQD